MTQTATRLSDFPRRDPEPGYDRQGKPQRTRETEWVVGSEYAQDGTGWEVLVYVSTSHWGQGWSQTKNLASRVSWQVRETVPRSPRDGSGTYTMMSWSSANVSARLGQEVPVARYSAKARDAAHATAVQTFTESLTDPNVQAIFAQATAEVETRRAA